MDDFQCFLCEKSEGIEGCKLVTDIVRGDDKKNHIIVKCNNCQHVQLHPHQYDFSDHYEQDLQTKYVIEEIGTSFENMLKYQKMEHEIRCKKFFDLNGNGDSTLDILDVGCGYGTFTHTLKNYFNDFDNNKERIHISGIDISEYRIKQSHDLYDMSNINLINSMVDKDFTNANLDSYNVITLWNVLEHVNDPYELVQNCYSMLKPGGKFIIEVPNLHDELLKLVPEFGTYFYIKDHISYFTKSIFEKMLDKLKINNYTIKGHQSYGIYNYFHWLEKKTTQTNPDLYPGHQRLWLEEIWKKTREEYLTSDHIHVVIVKE
jgi:2-polyprenyl-3-methyl-5-hydroxy-6-metoxy-1,4-benzoquinol methylase